MTRRYLVSTYGCQMNEHDSVRIGDLLEGAGFEAADGLDDADVVVLNTCCIRENADNKLYGHLGRLHALKQSRPDVQIVVGGCLAQKDRALVRERAPHVDVVLGTHNVHHVAALVERARRQGPIVEILDATDADDPEAFASALPVRREVPYAAWVTIQVGCDNSCAFCIVPAVRGREISRPPDQLEAEVAALAADGVVEVTLLGQNVNSYGRDLTRRRPLFADLLRRVGAIDGIRRVRYTSPHPKDLRPETIDAMAEVPAVCEHLHLPLQSGSDRVLAAMHRGYTAERYLERLARARGAVGDLAVTTDVIVGFPGETDDDFERTLEVVAEAGYDSAYTFVYSPRPGTEAATRTDEFVPGEVVAERFERLRAVVERSALARHEARVGRVEEVVVEGPSKKDAAVLSGRTRQHKLVHFRPAEPLRPGTFADVAITAAAPHHLSGELVAVTAPPRHKTRIPVAAGWRVDDDVTVGPESVGSGDARALLAGLFDDLAVRYPELARNQELEPFVDAATSTLVEPGGAFVVARRGGRAVACGGLRRLDGVPGVAELKRCFVTPPERRKGTSRRLLAVIEATAAARGFTELWLETGSRQVEAIGLYESSGWQAMACWGDFADDPLSRCFAKALTA